MVLLLSHLAHMKSPRRALLVLLQTPPVLLLFLLSLLLLLLLTAWTLPFGVAEETTAGGTCTAAAPPPPADASCAAFLMQFSSRSEAFGRWSMLNAFVLQIRHGKFLSRGLSSNFAAWKFTTHSRHTSLPQHGAVIGAFVDNVSHEKSSLQTKHFKSSMATTGAPKNTVSLIFIQK